MGANRSCHTLQKERLERIALVTLYKKSDESESLLSLFTKRATGANRSCSSLQKERWEGIALVTLYKKSDGRESLLFLFTKRAMGANRSCHSLQKERWEQFTLVALYQKGNRSFALKKRAIGTKNQGANSQPWIMHAYSLPSWWSTFNAPTGGDNLTSRSKVLLQQLVHINNRSFYMITSTEL